MKKLILLVCLFAFALGGKGKRLRSGVFSAF